jgi:hypothetical protein
MNILKLVLLLIAVMLWSLHLNAQEPVLEKLTAYKPATSRLDTKGRLTDKDRQVLKFALQEPEAAAEAAIDLWIDGQDAEYLELLWWRSKPDDRTTRLLVISLMNSQWEPTSALVPFGLYARRFKDDESHIRIDEINWHSENAKIVGKLLADALSKLAEGRQAPHLLRMIERYKVVALKGVGSL